ncbi:hypothetical protein N7520_009048 [Penicillium odoratum]|uniref:uncharacterized protein n=1 Tax=Penicillium odoratum TaxID=1167516 RepID=UPI00254745D2|nr:uncharacterized protein N7520_009048 [Penicillium odoratum]KAJ5752131.1 hypothetical protein N7520_009048 [Penicillium odoratum]
MDPIMDIQTAQNHNVVRFLDHQEGRVRLEIEEFLGDDYMTNLFLLALEAMHQEAMEPEDKQNWWTAYSLGGIHGSPKEKWNGVEPSAADPVVSPYGYCTHGMLMFPTWHRVYIGMFEQAVANKVRDIAKSFGDDEGRLSYLSAADRFRLPYWDPTLPRNKINDMNETFSDEIWGFPLIFRQRKVWVKRPQSKMAAQIHNPLFSFALPDADLLSANGRPILEAYEYMPKDGLLGTIRCPDEHGYPSLHTNDYPAAPTGANEVIPDAPIDKSGRINLDLKVQRQARSLSTKLWNLLSPHGNYGGNKQREWSAFASHFKYKSDGTIMTEPFKGLPKEMEEYLKRERGEKAKPGDKVPIFEDSGVSLESWHDAIHLLVGCGNKVAGHMGLPSHAAFDPIFWLHHNNIDRIFAIYQALYPEKWFPSNGTQRADDALFPFRKTLGNDKENFWNSDQVRNWERLGFAVPGDSQQLNENALESLHRYLFDYYGWSAEGVNPPKAVCELWPKDLSSSFALKGPKNVKSVEKPILVYEALVGTKLVTRTIDLTTAVHGQKLKVTDKDRTIAIDSRPDHELIVDYNSAILSTQDGKRFIWNAQLSVRKFAFNGSFNIHLFIGEVKDHQPERWLTKKNEVGFSAVFASTLDAPCTNCRKQAAKGAVYIDAIPITPALAAYHKDNISTQDCIPAELRVLDNFSVDEVKGFLEKNLSWRLTRANSEEITDEQEILDSELTICVGYREYKVPTDKNPFGTYEHFVPVVDITKKKLGGWGYGDK